MLTEQQLLKSELNIERLVAQGLAEFYKGRLIPIIQGASIVSSDLVQYAAASMPSDDASTSGGAIDSLRRIDFTQISSAERIIVVSSSSSDTTPTATVRGRKADGSIVQEVLTLNGTTNVLTTATYERIIKVELSTTCVGTITVKGNTSSTTFRTIPIGERGFMAIFRELASDPSSTKNFYCKFFWKNTNGTLALTSAQVLENADPSSVITHGLASSLDDSGTTTNRVTAPGGVSFAGTAANVPNSQVLSSGSGIGVWLDLTLAAGNAALRSTYTSEIDGQTT